MAARQDESFQDEDGLRRRAYPRYAVDCAAVVSRLTGAAQISAKMVDLSLGGCRVITEQRFVTGFQTRVEVQFQLRGTAFRFVGVTVGNRGAKGFSVRFLDMPTRRRDELAEVLAEVAAAKAAVADCPIPEPIAVVPDASVTAGDAVSVIDGMATVPDILMIPACTSALQDRRSHRRHAVDTSAKLLLLNSGICMAGRILNLSQGGCRLRTEERFTVGIYVRVETEFYLHGLPFRLAGVSQAIADKNTIGVRFLDMSERKRAQLTELIAEIDELEAIAQ
jgi:c-di-GMP-binding flagellar brake protein YcgR